jgi:tripartite-type tricarboxylate transporter receptor subunit TctC
MSNLKFLHRRQFLQMATAAAGLPTISGVARGQGQAYPSRPVHIVVGFPAAGATDISARLIAPRLSDRLGQTFLVENRAGASSNIATEAVVRAPADGHTLLVATCVNTINASLFQKLNFDFVRDVSAVAFIAYTPLLVVVHPSVPVNSIPELIAYAKANPRKLNLASAGFGTPIHVAGELFKMRTGTDMVQVQYQGGAPAVADLVGGQVQVMFDIVSECIEHVKAGKLRALAVTSTSRSDALPNVPVLAEFLPGFEATFWTGVCAPKGTPTQIIKTLATQINAATSDPGIQARFAELGSTVFPPRPPEQFAQFISQEAQKWGEVVRSAGMRAE